MKGLVTKKNDYLFCYSPITGLPKEVYIQEAIERKMGRILLNAKINKEIQVRYI